MQTWIHRQNLQGSSGRYRRNVISVVAYHKKTQLVLSVIHLRHQTFSVNPESSQYRLCDFKNVEVNTKLSVLLVYLDKGTVWPKLHFHDKFSQYASCLACKYSMHTTHTHRHVTLSSKEDFRSLITRPTSPFVRPLCLSQLCVLPPAPARSSSSPSPSQISHTSFALLTFSGP